MSTPRYILAKYAPDIHRMEPRNIGIMLWHKGRVTWQFLPSEKASCIVSDMIVYREWVDYWTQLVAGENIDAPGEPIISKRDESCIDAIIGTQEGNYILVDAGFVPAKLNVRDIPKAIAYLYGELVDTPDVDSDTLERQPSFASRCDELFEIAGIEVKRHHQLEWTLFGGRRKLHCDYYVGNGEPDAVFQRANLNSELSVNNAALLLHEVIERAFVARGKCAAIIDGRSLGSAAAQEGYDWLSRVCPVIDLEADNATDRVSQIVLDCVC